MLSRHASSLYWIGRYQERAEYLARYLQVKYFSTMDSSLTDYRDFTLRSVLFLSTGKIPDEKDIANEGEVLWNVALNPSSQNSIISYINAVRENVKGIRNLVSNEIWECVNKNYHFINQFDNNYLKTRGLYEFTNGVQENATIFNAKLENTILHDNVWAFIKMGIYIERIYQVSRTLTNTLIDVKVLNADGQSQTLENYQWLITLNALEARDMTRKLFKTTAQKENTCDFLITNLEFPKSISFCFTEFNKLVKSVKNSPDQINVDKKSIEFKSSKIASFLKYLDFNEVKDIGSILSYVLEEVMALNDHIHKDFFE